MAQTDAVVTIYECGDDTIVSIQHFSTEILTLNHTKREVMSCKGWSRTDQNIINIFFSLLDYDEYRARIENGILYIEKNGIPFHSAFHSAQKCLDEIYNIQSYAFKHFVNKLPDYRVKPVNK